MIEQVYTVYSALKYSATGTRDSCHRFFSILSYLPPWAQQSTDFVAAKSFDRNESVSSNPHKFWKFRTIRLIKFKLINSRTTEKKNNFSKEVNSFRILKQNTLVSLCTSSLNAYLELGNCLNEKQCPTFDLAKEFGNAFNVRFQHWINVSVMIK